jgi:hypothetical protein
MAVRDRPFLTEVWERVTDFRPVSDSAYVCATSPEERSDHMKTWEATAKNLVFVPIVRQDVTAFSAELQGETVDVPLRSRARLTAFWERVRSQSLYVDMTGLAHHVWAPLLRSALATGKPVRVVYVEPSQYRFSATPTEGEIFDLSERITGIAPLPGFASLSDPRNGDVCFVPLLGFEGTRLAYIIEQVQPPGGSVVPVIGVPGFRPEYPFHAYLGNQVPLLETHAWRNVRYAIANCPFSLFYTLEDIAGHYPRSLLRVAPIGTKPHALGAVLFTLASARPVELVYDHPIRKATRTSGSSRLLVYHVSSLLGATGTIR